MSRNAQSTYDSQNQIKTSNNAFVSTLAYDPLGRLWENAAGTSASRFSYDGLEPLTNQDTTGTLWRRNIYGPATDEMLVQYQDQGAVKRRFTAADERGSVIAMSDDSGNATAMVSFRLAIG